MHTTNVVQRRRRSGLVSTIGAAAVLGLVIAGPFAGSAVAAGRAVLIVDSASAGYAFSPKSITIHAGDRVTWTNKSKAPHNVEFTSLGGGSPDLGTGGSYGRTFKKAGTFGYICTIHYFTGTVVVLAAPGGPTPEPTSKPTAKPTPKPTPKPTAKPTPKPTAEPTAAPTETPAPSPTPRPTATPVSTDGPGASSEASPTLPAVAFGSGSPAPGSTSPPTEPASDASGPPVGILAGLLVLVVAVVAGLRFRR